MASVGGIWGGNASSEKTRRNCTFSVKFVFDFKQEMSMTIMHSFDRVGIWSFGSFARLGVLPD